MASSFDSLVSRRGSPTHSYRSGSTNPSTSNVSETRDLSRQSEQRQRLNHRRAIQVRKIAFLVLVLLLLVGGLSYAIYKVVSNNTEENESEKVKLEEGKKVRSTAFPALFSSTISEQNMRDSSAILPSVTATSSPDVQLSSKQSKPITSPPSPTTKPSLSESILPSGTATSSPDVQLPSQQSKPITSPPSPTAETFDSQYHISKKSTNIVLPSESLEIPDTTAVKSLHSSIAHTSAHMSTQNTPPLSNMFTSTHSPGQYAMTSGTNELSKTSSLEARNTLTSRPFYFSLSETSMKHEKSSAVVEVSSHISQEKSKDYSKVQEVKPTTTSFHSRDQSIRSSSSITTQEQLSAMKSSSIVSNQILHQTTIGPTPSASNIQKLLSTDMQSPSVSLQVSQSESTNVRTTKSTSVNELKSTFVKTARSSSLNIQASSMSLGVSKIESTYQNPERSSLPSGQSPSLATEANVQVTGTTNIAQSFATTTEKDKLRTTSEVIQTVKSVMPSVLISINSNEITSRKTSVSNLSEIKQSVSTSQFAENSFSASSKSNIILPSSSKSLLHTPSLIDASATVKTVISGVAPNNTVHSGPMSSVFSKIMDTIVHTPSLIDASATVKTVISGVPPNNTVHSGPISSVFSKMMDTIVPSMASASYVPSSSIWIAPYYYEWGNWTTCSLECGGGYKHRTRNCSEDGKCDHLGSSVNVTTCNMHPCNETTFDVSLNATAYNWTEDYKNKSSKAYKDLVDRLMEELRLLYGPNISVQVDNISQGSVIVSFTITLPGTRMIEELTDKFQKGRIGNLTISLIEITNKMVPRQPISFIVQNTTYNSTMIHWSGPQITNGILLGYKAIIEPGNITININPKETSWRITKLIPESTYTVQLFGYNINGDGDRKHITFKTKEAPPHYLPWGEWSSCSRECGGGKTTRTRNCSKEGLCSHLGESEQSEHCNVYKCNTTSYNVGLNMTNVDWSDDLYNTSSQAYQELLAKFIAELQKKYPNATISFGSITKGSIIFHFTITMPEDTSVTEESLADDLESNGLGNYTTDVKTIEDNSLPRSPPESINVTMVTHHSAKVRWHAIREEDSNGAILGYVIVLFSSDNKKTIFNVTAKASDVNFYHDFSGLLPNTTYRFYMYGFNINGKGVNSNNISFTTKVQIPKISSANISHITPNSATLNWNRIPDNNATYGIIAGYKIFLFGHDTRLELEASSIEGKFKFATLHPNTTYNATILGFNEHGEGVLSAIYAFTTMALIPKMKSVVVENITSNMATLKWEHISSEDQRYGGIRGYKIIISSRTVSSNITLLANISQVVLRNLSSNTSYCVQAFAYNEYGDGLKREARCFTTMENTETEDGKQTTRVSLVISSPSTTNQNISSSLNKAAMSSAIQRSTHSQMLELSISSSMNKAAMSSAIQRSTNAQMLGLATSTSSLKYSHATSLRAVSSESSSMKFIMASHTVQSSMVYTHNTLPHSSTSLTKSKTPDIQSAMYSQITSKTSQQISPSHFNLLASSTSRLPFTEQTPTPEPTPEPTNTPQSDEEYIVGKLRLTGENFSNELRDKNSQEFKDLKNTMERSLTSLFNDNNLKVKKVNVTGFTQGSVVVEFYVTYAKVLNYQPENVTFVLLTAKNSGGLNNKAFDIDPNDFTQTNQKPEPEPTLNPINEADKGLQKNDDGDDDALIVAVIMCVLLLCGAVIILIFVGKKRNWFNRSRRKVVPDDDDDDDDDDDTPDLRTKTERLRLSKTARGPRRARGAIINAGQDTTEC